MAPDRSRFALRMAVVGSLVGTAVPLLVGIVGYGDPWQEALVTAAATGLGVGVVFYLYYATVVTDGDQ